MVNVRVAWKKELCITLQELPRLAYKWYLVGMATQYGPQPAFPNIRN